MSTSAVPIPVQDPIATPRNWAVYPNPRGEADPNEGRMPLSWIQYFTSLVLSASLSPQRLVVESLTQQDASIGATSLNIGTTSSGLFLVQARARISRAATASSSLALSIGWTESGLSLTSSPFAAITGNTTTSNASGSVMVLIDAASPITYTTTYASVGATAMQYTLSIIVQQIYA